jgi:hypothetical protein
VKPRSSLKNRPTQTSRIVALLRERSPHWVPLPEILALRISQYAARIYQARHEWGLNIENRVEITHGEKRSWFRLIELPSHEPASVECTARAAAANATAPLFPNSAPVKYRDPEEGGRP